MKKILFVDDEKNLLQGLRRMLHSMRRKWHMGFVESASAAMDYLAENPVDVIVTDIRMPGTDGIQLLKQVRELYPQIIRIILSGHSDYSASIESTGVAHQFLSKPCAAQLLIDTIEKSLELEEHLHNANLQKLITSVGALPSPPGLFVSIEQALQSDETGLTQIAELVEQDMAMTAKILQLVNSAFFGLPRSIASVSEALTYLGVSTLKSLILMQGVFTQLAEQKNVNRQTIEDIWQHSLQVSHLAKEIARQQKLSAADQEASAVAGLLHDIGQFLLQIHLQEEYAEIRRQALKQQLPIELAERQALGCTHADVGAFLLSLWGLSATVVEVVQQHHQPQTDTTFNVTAAVYFANMLVDKGPDSIDRKYLLTVAGEQELQDWCNLPGYLSL